MAFQDVAGPTADLAGKSKNFAGTNRQGNRSSQFCRTKFINSENFRPEVGRFGRIHSSERTTDHPLDQRRGSKLRHGNAGLTFTIAQHGHPMGQIEYFGQTMRHIDHRPALLGQGVDDALDPLYFTLVKGSGGFVKDQNACLPRNGSSHFDEMPLGHGKRSDWDRWIEMLKADPFQIGRGQLLQFPWVIHNAESPRSKKNVLRNRHRGNKTEFLLNNRDPQGLGICRLPDLDRAACNLDGARVGRVKTGEDFDEGTLTCPVFSHEGHNFPGPYLEVDISQRLDGAEELRDRQRFQQWPVACFYLFRRCLNITNHQVSG